MSITAIHHTAISTPDFERAITFWTDVMGFELDHQSQWDTGRSQIDAVVGLQGSAARQAMLRLGSTHIEIFEYTRPTPKPGDPARPACDHGITHVCLATDDIHGDHARLAAAGVEFHCPPQQLSPSTCATYGRDPDGNIFELLQLTE